LLGTDDEQFRMASTDDDPVVVVDRPWLSASGI
jgi:hypothetical protein